MSPPSTPLISHLPPLSTCPLKRLTVCRNSLVSLTLQEEAARTLFDEAMNVATTATRSDVCSDPNAYVSYDGLHPTSVVHRFAIAEPFAEHLRWL